MNRYTNYKTVSWLFVGVLVFAAIIFGLMFNSCDNNNETTRYIRKNANSPEAQSDLEEIMQKNGLMKYMPRMI